MPPRTSNDLTPVLSGASFRRLSCDGRVWVLRAIPTMTELRRTHPAATLPLASARFRTGRSKQGSKTFSGN